MKDVCARTGLARSTIHHYIREGVLPRPATTRRNTALYDEEFVRRVELVKALQRTHLPLAAIRETLAALPDGSVDPTDVERFVDIARRVADTLRLSSERPIARGELLEASGLSAPELIGLERVGLIESSGGRYPALDARIALAFGRLRAAGITVEPGYLEVVAAYRKHLAAIARAEARHLARTMRALANVDVDAHITRTAGPVGDLIAALHRKALSNAVTELIENGRT